MSEKKIDLKINATPDEMKAISADFVNFEPYNGYIVMNFLQTVITGDSNESGNKTGFVMTRVMFSWEQFASVTRKMIDYMKATQELAEFQHSAAVSFANNFKMTDEENTSE